MSSLFILVPISLLLGILALILFLWVYKKKHFDDTEGIKYRILHDDDDDK